MMLAILLLAGVLAVANRIIAETWLAPAPFFCLYWLANLAMGLLLNGIFPVTAAGLAVLASMMVAFSVGSLALHAPGGGPMPVHGRRFESEVIDSRLHMTLIVLSAIAFLGVVLEARASLQEFSLTLSFLSFFEIGAAASSARYAEINAGAGGLAATLIYFIYAAAPVGGVVSAAATSRKWRLLGTVPVVMSVIEGTVTAARAGILLSFCMWTGGWLATKIFVLGGRPRIGVRRAAMVGAGLVAGAVGIYAGLQWVRWGVGNGFAWQPIAETAAAKSPGARLGVLAVDYAAGSRFADLRRIHIRGTICVTRIGTALGGSLRRSGVLPGGSGIQYLHRLPGPDRGLHSCGRLAGVSRSRGDRNPGLPGCAIGKLVLGDAAGTLLCLCAVLRPRQHAVLHQHRCSLDDRDWGVVSDCANLRFPRASGGDVVTSKIALITVNYLDVSSTQRLLENLSGLRGAEAVRVVVVDNASVPEDRARLDGAVGRFRGRGEVVRPAANLYYWGGAALALQQPSVRDSDWLIICNSDVTFPDPDFLDRLQALDPITHPVIAPNIVSERTGELQNPFQRTGMGRLELLKWRLYFTHYQIARAMLAVKALGGGQPEGDAFVRDRGGSHLCAARRLRAIFSRRFFDLGGALDTGFTLYGEEMSLGAIARRLGLPVVYTPALRVLHAEHANTGKGLSPAKYRHQREAFAYCYRKYGSSCWTEAHDEQQPFL